MPGPLADRLRPVTRRLVVLIAVVAIAVAGLVVYVGSLGCAGNASCPPLATLNGVRYGYTPPRFLPGLEQHLSPATTNATNTPVAPFLSDMTLFTAGAVDSSLVLLGRAKPAEEPGDFIVLFSLQRTREAFAALCGYVASTDPRAAPECGDE